MYTLITLLRVPYLGRIGSTKLVLPKWHKYGTLNRVIRVIIFEIFFSGNTSVLCFQCWDYLTNIWRVEGFDYCNQIKSDQNIPLCCALSLSLQKERVSVWCHPLKSPFLPFSCKKKVFVSPNQQYFRLVVQSSQHFQFINSVLFTPHKVHVLQFISKWWIIHKSSFEYIKALCYVITNIGK